jgi:hypothetical protein
LAQKEIFKPFKGQTIFIFRALSIAFIKIDIIVLSTVITVSNVYTICDGKSAVHGPAN